MVKASVAIVAIGSLVFLAQWRDQPLTTRTHAALPAATAPSATPLPVNFQVPALPAPTIATVEPKTLAELMAIPRERLGDLDIALVNLLCATDLPGSEELDIPKIRRTLDLWALAVRGETTREFHQFTRNPDAFQNSEPFFRMLILLTVLQRDLGVHYNLDKVNDPDFGNSQDQFIHGMVNSSNGGTCVSLPVLYVAVGRRLGYPMKLVLAHEHVFCRWDDGKGTVKNFEGSGHGLSSKSDDFYRKWPRPISDQDMKQREFLVSLTPMEELSVFLAARGHCFADQQRLTEARACYHAAATYFPSATAYQTLIGFLNVGINPARQRSPQIIYFPPPQDPRMNQLRDIGMPQITHPRDKNRR